MTPVFCCGFECGRIVLGGNLGEHWPTTIGAGTASISTTTVRSGARSLRYQTTGANTMNISTTALASSTRWIGRVYVYFATALPTADVILVAYDSSGTGPVVRFKNSDSKIYAGVGSTLGASGVTVTTGTWYRLDFDFNCNTGGNDTCDVQVDGSACGQATATGSSAASTTITTGVFGANSTADVFFDDVLLSQTAADYPLGAGKVDHFVPTSDGTHNVAGANDFEFSGTGTDITNATTTAFTLIDEVPLDTGTPTDYINLIAPPNATDYVECVFGPASGISTPTYAPRAVEIIAAYASSAVGTNNLRLAVNDNGTTNDMFNANAAGATTCLYARKHYATAPTGGAWVITSGAGNFNNLRIRCLTNDAAPDPFFVGIMVEAGFQDADIPAGRTTHNTRAFPLGEGAGMGFGMGDL